MLRKVTIFVVLYTLLMVALIVSIVAIIESNKTFSKTSNSAAVITGLVIAMLVPPAIFIYWIFRTPAWEATVRESGKTASALVKRSVTLPIHIGNSRYQQVVLEVRPAGEPAFEAEIEKPKSQVGFAQEGQLVEVKYDPTNKRRVVLLGN